MPLKTETLLSRASPGPALLCERRERSQLLIPLSSLAALSSASSSDASGFAFPVAVGTLAVGTLAEPGTLGTPAALAHATGGAPVDGVPSPGAHGPRRRGKGARAGQGEVKRGAAAGLGLRRTKVVPLGGSPARRTTKKNAP